MATHSSLRPKRCWRDDPEEKEAAYRRGWVDWYVIEKKVEVELMTVFHPEDGSMDDYCLHLTSSRNLKGIGSGRTGDDCVALAEGFCRSAGGKR